MIAAQDSFERQPDYQKMKYYYSVKKCLMQYNHHTDNANASRC